MARPDESVRTGIIVANLFCYYFLFGKRKIIIHPFIGIPLGDNLHYQNLFMHWSTESSEYIVQHHYFTARKDVCKMPNGYIVDPYFVVELPASACAMALTAEGEMIMIRQYRHPIHETLLEVPGGFIDEQEDPVVAMRRELLEETGYEFADVQLLVKTAANPGVLNNFTYLFLATGGKKIAAQKLDHNEEIDIELLPLETVRGLLDEGKIVQALHACCLFYGFNKLGQ